jgi:hypothetical protein
VQDHISHGGHPENRYAAVLMMAGRRVAAITPVRANPGLYGHARLWLDVGAQDSSFAVADQQFANALHIHLHMWPGGHDFGYWNARWNNYLGFYTHALATCR